MSIKPHNISVSVDKVLAITKTITTIRIKLPQNNKLLTRTMLITSKHKLIAPLFGKEFWG
jgi:hypothetical protein